MDLIFTLTTSIDGHYDSYTLEIKLSNMHHGLESPIFIYLGCWNVRPTHLFFVRSYIFVTINKDSRRMKTTPSPTANN